MNVVGQERPTLVDTHAHLDDERLRADLEGVVSRAKDANVAQIITVGTTVATSAVAVEIAQTHRGIFAAIGIHPNDASAAGQQRLATHYRTARKHRSRRRGGNWTRSPLEPYPIP